MVLITNHLRFSVWDSGSRPQFDGYPHVVLGVDRWDDFGYQTMYDVVLRLSHEVALELGSVKILQRGQRSGRPAINSSFSELGPEFCSIGQDIEYYEKLMELDDGVRRIFLEGLRDAVYKPSIENEFASEPGWKTSLLRFGQAVDALTTGRNLLTGIGVDTDRLDFSLGWRHNETLTVLPFTFDDSGVLPGRCNILIGYNGVGKTTLLAQLALAASSGEDSTSSSTNKSLLSGRDTTFGAVITISYSAFDTFPTPERLRGDQQAGLILTPSESSTAFFGYIYCGLRRETSTRTNNSREELKSYELKSINEIEDEFVSALDTAGRRNSGGHLVAAFEALAREPSFGQVGVDLARLGRGVDSARATEAFQQLSTGHKIVLNIVAQLAAHLRTRSLVLIDEPETHLHPPLVAALLRAIQVLLRAHSSFAVIATHSPVVVQELPSQSVRILERFGTIVNMRRPEIETFAENIGAITRHVFSLDSSATDYQGILATLSESFSSEQIDNMFENGLSVQGRAFIANYRRHG